MNYIDVIMLGIAAFLAGSLLTYIFYKKLLGEIAKLREDWVSLENRLTTKLAVIDNKVSPVAGSVTINPNNKF